MTTKENVTEVMLSAESHIECPYTTYRALHSSGQAGFDPDIGLAVVDYDELVSMSKNTTGFSSSISLDDQGPRHMGVGGGCCSGRCGRDLPGSASDGECAFHSRSARSHAAP